MTRRAGRRLVAVALAAAGLLVLARDAVEAVRPLGASLRLARRFWGASAEERLANAPFLRGEPELARTLLAADRALAPGVPIVLRVPEALPAEAAEERRRAAAYVLAPRVVSLARHAGGGYVVAPRRLAEAAP